MALATGVLAVSIALQHRAIRILREENAALRAELAQRAELAKEEGAASARAAEASGAPFVSSEPSRELLRLRGEVGVLRRQLVELEQLTNVSSRSQPPRVPIPAEVLRVIEALRVETEAEYSRVNTMVKQLKAKASDSEGLLEAILATGLRDDALNSLVAQREAAAGGLEASQKVGKAQAPQNEALANEVAELTTKIGLRCQGMVMGLDAKAAALRESLDSMQRDIDQARQSP
jgi:hypothetical protein